MVVFESLADIGRADDGNVYLDAVEAQWRRAADELHRRNLPLDGADDASIEGTAEAGREHSPADVTPELASVPGAAASPRKRHGFLSRSSRGR